MAEVVRPAEQKAVQRVAYLWPWIVVTGHKQIADLSLEPLQALLGWARAQIPFAVCFVTVWSERVAYALGEGPDAVVDSARLI